MENKNFNNNNGNNKYRFNPERPVAQVNNSTSFETPIAEPTKTGFMQSTKNVVKSKPLALVAGITVLTAIGVGCYFWRKRSKKANETAAEETDKNE